MRVMFCQGRRKDYPLLITEWMVYISFVINAFKKKFCFVNAYKMFLCIYFYLIFIIIIFFLFSSNVEHLGF